MAQTKSVVSVQEARQIAQKSLQFGQPKLALDIANQLLIRDPNDQSLKFLKTSALLRLNKTKDARKTALGVFRTSTDQHSKFLAARLIAQSYHQEKALTRSQLWLRRAANFSPDANAKNNTKQQFSKIRAANPWSFNLNFGASPNSNINNGTKSVGETLGGLGFIFLPSSQPLSGLEYMAQGAAQYRFRVSKRVFGSVGASILAQTYTLSSQAKSLVPTAQGADYSFVSLAGTYSFTIAPNAQKNKHMGPTIISGQFGRTFYGKTALSNFVALSAEKSYYLSPRNRLNFTTTAHQQNRIGNRARNSLTLIGSVGLMHQVSAGNTAGIKLTAFNTDSSSAEIENSGASVDLTYKIKTENKVFDPDFHLGFKNINYQRAFLSSAARRDQNIALEVGFTLKKLSLYGFIPKLTLGITKNLSNSARHKTAAQTARFGFQSEF